MQVRLIVGWHHRLENMGMPSRHIPSHAFDEILTELGDDPAIPDPHGIRKTNPNKSADSGRTGTESNNAKSLSWGSATSVDQIKKWMGIVPAIACLLGLFIAVFIAYETQQGNAQANIDASQLQIIELKKDIATLRSEWGIYQEDIYNEMDILEVSIHLLKENQGKTKAAYRPQALPHETEIRRWRYLGHSQMGDTKRAFFQTDKGNATFEKGTSVLGEWHLTHIEKSSVSLTHPQGKSLTLKAFKSE